MMKKIVMVLICLVITQGITLASSTPELLENLTTQILIQQTLEKSGKEVLDQLKPMFAQCAKSHKDKTLQEACKTFLEKHLLILEKKRDKVKVGGFSVTHLGKLPNKERFAYFGLDNAHYSLQSPYFSEDEVEYAVLKFPEFALSFFVPTLSEKNRGLKDNGIRSECENLKKGRERGINFLKQESPNHIGQIMDEEEGVKNTICSSGFRIQRYPHRTKDIFVTSTFNTTGDQIGITISPKQFGKGETLESIAEQQCLKGNTTVVSNIYFDKTGGAYYPSDYEGMRRYSGESFSGLAFGTIGATSKLIKKPLGVGKNLQRMIESGEAKVLVCRGNAYLQSTNNAQGYYKISFTRPPLLLGYYVGLDLNTPEGTSSFLTQ